MQEQHENHATTHPYFSETPRVSHDPGVTTLQSSLPNPQNLYTHSNSNLAVRYQSTPTPQPTSRPFQHRPIFVPPTDDVALLAMRYGVTSNGKNPLQGPSSPGPAGPLSPTIKDDLSGSTPIIETPIGPPQRSRKSASPRVRVKAGTSPSRPTKNTKTDSACYFCRGE